MRFEPFVGLRYLMAKRERNVLSIITLISVAGVAVGVMALIVVLSVMGGFEGDLRKKILGTKSHIAVTAVGGYINDYRAVSKAVKGVDGVVGATPFVEGEVMINAMQNLQVVVLHGVIPSEIGEVSELAKNMKEGSIQDLSDPDAVSRSMFPSHISKTPHSASEQIRRSARRHADFVDSALEKEPPPPENLDPAQPDERPASATLSPGAQKGPRRSMPAIPGMAPANTGSTQGGAKRKMGGIPGMEPSEKPRRKVGGLVIGQELKKNLGVYVGQEVNVMSPMGDVGPSGRIPKSRPFRIVGVFYSGMYEYDTQFAYMTLEDAQSFLGIGDRATGIEVKVEDPDKSLEIKDEVERTLQGSVEEADKLVVQDWRQMNANLFSALLLEKIAMFIILTFIILVASFSIVCLLIMIVIEKGREIAIMKSMGATNRSIMGIFVIQGGAIGVLGTALGLGLGLLVTHLIASWGIQLDPDVYYISQLPIEVRPMEVTLICTSAVLISLLATVYPSIQAAKLDPVEGLRYE